MFQFQVLRCYVPFINIISICLIYTVLTGCPHALFNKPMINFYKSEWCSQFLATYMSHFSVKFLFSLIALKL